MEISTILLFFGVNLGNAEVETWLENQIHDPGCTCPACLSAAPEEEEL